MSEMQDFLGKLVELETIIARAKRNPNEIEEIFLAQLDNVTTKVDKLREAMFKSQENGTTAGWEAIIEQYRKLRCVSSDLDMILYSIRSSVENFPYHNGVDG